ncbi:MAG: hypothetical protein ACI9JL_002697 [Paracoccaceae bacterium]|jgi:hypothetical protein
MIVSRYTRLQHADLACRVDKLCNGGVNTPFFMVNSSSLARFVCHDLNVVRLLCDPVNEMNIGVPVEQSPADQILLEA